MVDTSFGAEPPLGTSHHAQSRAVSEDEAGASPRRRRAFIALPLGACPMEEKDANIAPPTEAEKEGPLPPDPGRLRNLRLRPLCDGTDQSALVTFAADACPAEDERAGEDPTAAVPSAPTERLENDKVGARQWRTSAGGKEQEVLCNDHVVQHAEDEMLSTERLPTESISGTREPPRTKSSSVRRKIGRDWSRKNSVDAKRLENLPKQRFLSKK